MPADIALRHTPARDRRGLALLAALAALALIALLALRLGYRPVTWAELAAAFTAYDPADPAQIVIREIRLPRIAAALLAGTALGIAGALIQGMTRNPLADPGLLGINAGAAVGVIGAVFLLRISDPSQFIWTALAGGALGAVAVFALGGGAQARPVRLLLAGAALTAFFLALIRALVLVSRQSLETYRFWVLGGFENVTTDSLAALWPFFLGGALVALAAALLIDALSLGDDTARGLGVNVGGARLLCGCAIVLLAASTVALAGPIAFVGLIVPHMARAVMRQDMIWLAPCSGIFGACLLLLADLAGRSALFGGTMQAGVMSALIGGPLLIWLIRRTGGSRT
ncbi:FecCD family ABC transporter permease [Lutimaribacter marinistellae]|uniref:FecCD family ABC transporter permease n=1 Tax=Lutimaribacter marinistellae TaxID=1820329 RepID=A0ABV7TH15_9RHOB